MIYENRWVKGTITAASFGVATVLIVAVVGAVIWPAMFGLAFELAVTVGGWVLHTAGGCSVCGCSCRLSRALLRRVYRRVLKGLRSHARYERTNSKPLSVRQSRRTNPIPYYALPSKAYKANKGSGTSKECR
jgi:hypothetical protein